MQNFIQIGLGVSVLRMRDFAPLGSVTRLLFWFLRKASRDARTDFDAVSALLRGNWQDFN